MSSVPLLDAVAAAHAGAVPPRPAGWPVVLDEFLARPELDSLVDWVTTSEAEFRGSRVLGADERGRDDLAHRRSRVLFAPGPVRDLFEQRLMSAFDHVRTRLGLPAFPVDRIEMQITASNDGEYFRVHADNSHRALAPRRLTYVYFFHREPVRFLGGNLRFYGPWHPGTGRTARPLLEVVPRQNQLVCFAPHWFHEIETVRCPSGRFLDSRFTVNGWFRSGAQPSGPV